MTGYRSASQDVIPIKEESRLIAKIQDHITMYHPDSLAILETNVNDLSPWYNRFGEEQRERAMRAFFSTIVEMQMEYEGRLFRAGRSTWDRFLLFDTGDSDDLEVIALDLQERISATRIPNPACYSKMSCQWKGQVMELDPEHLTVRVGAVYQRHGDYDLDSMLIKAREAAKQAKTAPDRILVVEFNPIL